MNTSPHCGHYQSPNTVCSIVWIVQTLKTSTFTLHVSVQISTGFQTLREASTPALTPRGKIKQKIPRSREFHPHTQLQQLQQPAVLPALSTALQLTVCHTSHTSCCLAPSASPWALTLCSLITHHVPAHEVSNVNHHVYLRGPHFKLPLPGGEGGQGHDHQERAVELVLMEQVGQEWDCLNRLAQPHFISQDHAVVPEKENKQKCCLSASFCCCSFIVNSNPRQGQRGAEQRRYLNTSKWIPRTARLNMEQ